MHYLYYATVMLDWRLVVVLELIVRKLGRPKGSKNETTQKDTGELVGMDIDEPERGAKRKRQSALFLKPRGVALRFKTATVLSSI